MFGQLSSANPGDKFFATGHLSTGTGAGAELLAIGDVSKRPRSRTLQVT